MEKFKSCFCVISGFFFGIYFKDRVKIVIVIELLVFYSIWENKKLEII